jgi:hypothetical protein
MVALGLHVDDELGEAVRRAEGAALAERRERLGARAGARRAARADAPSTGTLATLAKL